MFHAYWPFVAILTTVCLLVAVLAFLKFGDRLFLARLTCRQEHKLVSENEEEDFLDQINQDFALSGSEQQFTNLELTMA